MKIEQTERSETSAYKIQTSGNYPEESIQHSQHGESLKLRIFLFAEVCFDVVSKYTRNVLESTAVFIWNSRVLREATEIFETCRQK